MGFSLKKTLTKKDLNNITKQSKNVQFIPFLSKFL